MLTSDDLLTEAQVVPKEQQEEVSSWRPEPGFTFRYPHLKDGYDYKVVDGKLEKAKRSKSFGFMVCAMSEGAPVPVGHIFFVSEGAFEEIRQRKDHFHKFGQRVWEVAKLVRLRKSSPPSRTRSQPRAHALLLKPSQEQPAQPPRRNRVPVRC